MSRIEVPMPQMGESIAEGTVSKWLKKVGDSVERDEPILEISTDKVDAEIPAPQGGILTEVVVPEGETVEVGTIVAYIDSEATPSSSRGAPGEVSQPAPPVPSAERLPESTAQAAATQSEDGRGGSEQSAAGTGISSDPGGMPSGMPSGFDGGAVPASPPQYQGFSQRSTPVVRRMAKEYGIDLSELEGYGSGHGGRVTKQDLLEYLGGREDERPEDAPAAEAVPVQPDAGVVMSQRSTAAAAPSPPTAPEAPRPPISVGAVRSRTEPSSELWRFFHEQVQHPEFPAREGDEVASMDKVRRLTAEHMVLAKRIAPHVHSLIEIDFTQIEQIRRENRERWREQGVKVSFTAVVAWAVSRVLREFPMVNATASGNDIIYRGSVNLGIAVDLDPGLIVPVIRDADDLSLVGIAKKVADLAQRARSRQLAPDEIQGASFTITNPGVLGTLVGMPIIPKGTAGILGTGGIEKRVVVISDPETAVDSIAIRKRSIFCLGYDHRIVDGADAARFLSQLKHLLQEFPDDA